MDSNNTFIVYILIGLSLMMNLMTSSNIIILNDIDDNITTNETTYSSYKIESYFENLNGSDNAYACLNANGTLFRNISPCV